MNWGLRDRFDEYARVSSLGWEDPREEEETRMGKLDYLFLFPVHGATARRSLSLSTHTSLFLNFIAFFLFGIVLWVMYVGVGKYISPVWRCVCLDWALLLRPPLPLSFFFPLVDSLLVKRSISTYPRCSRSGPLGGLLSRLLLRELNRLSTYRHRDGVSVHDGAW